MNLMLWITVYAVLLTFRYAYRSLCGWRRERKEMATIRLLLRAKDARINALDTVVQHAQRELEEIHRQNRDLEDRIADLTIPPGTEVEVSWSPGDSRA